jgi:hypothetical protein
VAAEVSAAATGRPAVHTRTVMDTDMSMGTAMDRATDMVSRLSRLRPRRLRLRSSEGRKEWRYKCIIDGLDAKVRHAHVSLFCYISLFSNGPYIIM